MKKIAIFASLFAGVMILSGCDETHDIPYFKAHQDEMKQVLEECGKQNMDSWSDNCKNAQEADHQIKSDKLFAPSKK